jgi:hypothetical protein
LAAISISIKGMFKSVKEATAASDTNKKGLAEAKPLICMVATPGIASL